MQFENNENFNINLDQSMDDIKQRDSAVPSPLSIGFYSNVVEEKQFGKVFAGAGAIRDRKAYSLSKLSSKQREKLEGARKFAREQGIKAALLKQTITHQQQQNINLQYNVQRQQALALMCRIYVGSINFVIKEEEVRQAFLPFGPIKSMSMPYDMIGKHHKGFAFLEYETPEAAFLSLEHMNGMMIAGYSIKVGRPSNMPQAQNIIEKIVEESKLYNRIYIASVHPSLTESDIKSVFEAFGQIKSCNLAADPMRHGKHKEYGYIEYEQPHSAIEAVASMHNFNLGGRYLRVGRAVTPPTILSQTTTTNSLPMASAIAAAAVTAKITELEAIGKTAVPGLVEMKAIPPPAVVIPTLSFQSSPASSGFSSEVASSIPPPSVYIPPSMSTPTTSQQTSTSSLLNSVMKKEDKDMLPEVSSLQQQEDLKIKGHQARHLVMQKLLRKQESRVVVLKNMVGPEDVDDNLEEEVSEECSKFGAVERVVIYQEKQGENDDDVVIVKIFVEFQDHEGVKAAVKSLDGRYFAGRRVQATQYEQELYDVNDFTA